MYLTELSELSFNNEVEKTKLNIIIICWKFLPLKINKSQGTLPS